TRGRLQRRDGVDVAGEVDRPHPAAGGLREPLVRRTEAQPPLHGGEPVDLRGLRQHPGGGAGMNAIEMPVNRLKRALRGGDVQVGLWSTLASPIAAEIVGGSGFDWVLLDTEHSSNEVSDVHRLLQAMQGCAS